MRGTSFRGRDAMLLRKETLLTPARGHPTPPRVAQGLVREQTGLHPRTHRRRQLNIELCSDARAQERAHAHVHAARLPCRRRRVAAACHQGVACRDEGWSDMNEPGIRPVDDPRAIRAA